MSDNSKLPARHADQVPAESDHEARLPAPPGTNGGIIKHGFSRLWARLGRGTTDDNTRFVESQTRYVKAYGELADTAYSTKRKVDSLRHDLPSQLAVDRAQHQDQMEQAQHDIEMRKQQRAADLATLKANDERDRMTRDLDYITQQADKRRVLHHAARNELDAKVQRDIRTSTASMELERAITAFQTGDFVELNKFMLAKESFEKRWPANSQLSPPAATPPEQKLATLQEMMKIAKASNATPEFKWALQEQIDATNEAIQDAIDATNAAKTIP